MTIGVDTTLLVESELEEVTGHEQAKHWLGDVIRQHVKLAIAPQVLGEFIHAVTDPARFVRPLNSQQAISRAQEWWTASEVRQVHPTADAVMLFLEWMSRYKLGRKRVLDTMLAATYFAHGIDHVVTSNSRDFAVFSGMTTVNPRG